MSNLVTENELNTTVNNLNQNIINTENNINQNIINTGNNLQNQINNLTPKEPNNAIYKLEYNFKNDEIYTIHGSLKTLNENDINDQIIIIDSPDPAININKNYENVWPQYVYNDNFSISTNEIAYGIISYIDDTTIQLSNPGIPKLNAVGVQEDEFKTAFTYAFLVHYGGNYNKIGTIINAKYDKNILYLNFNKIDNLSKKGDRVVIFSNPNYINPVYFSIQSSYKYLSPDKLPDKLLFERIGPDKVGYTIKLYEINSYNGPQIIQAKFNTNDDSNVENRYLVTLPGGIGPLTLLENKVQDYNFGSYPKKDEQIVYINSFYSDGTKYKNKILRIIYKDDIKINYSIDSVGYDDHYKKILLYLRQKLELDVDASTKFEIVEPPTPPTLDLLKESGNASEYRTVYSIPLINNNVLTENSKAYISRNGTHFNPNDFDTERFVDEFLSITVYDNYDKNDANKATISTISGSSLQTMLVTYDRNDNGVPYSILSGTGRFKGATSLLAKNTLSTPTIEISYN